MSCSSTLHPCLFCLCSKATWTSDLSMNTDSWPWVLITAAMYEAACAANEQWLTLSEAERLHIAPYLWYDKPSHGGSGRCLRVDLPVYGLCAGDRLEPCSASPDIDKFTSLEGTARVLFWRQSVNPRVRHRNPLLHADIGTSVTTLVIDSLHSLNSGPMKEFCMHALWEMILSNCWSVNANCTHEEVVALSCRHIKNEMQSFCKSLPAGSASTPVEEFCQTMIGTRNERCLALKASETKTVFLYVCEALSCKRERVLRGDVWAAGAASIRDLTEVMGAATLNIDAETHEECGVCVAVA